MEDGAIVYYDPDDSVGYDVYRREEQNRDLEIRKHLQSFRASLVSREERQVKLQAGLWDSLPEEILWNIMARLPMLSQRRLRCVSWKWRMLLSKHSSGGLPLGQLQSRPSCMITTIQCGFDTNRDHFCCHAENRWFCLPEPTSCEDSDWELVATDGGLLCYRGRDTEFSWCLLVFNPCTGSSRVLRPPVPEEDTLSFTGFVVDSKAKTYKVVLSRKETSGAEEMMVFESKSQEWKAFQIGGVAFAHSFDMTEPAEFVWKNRLYMRGARRTYLAFDLESGQWSAIDVNLPCEAEACYHIGCKGDQLLLVAISFRVEGETIRIWKLDSTTDSPDLSTTRWETIPIDVPDLFRPLLSECEDFSSHGQEYVYFAVGSSHHLVTYTLETRKWSVMPDSEKYRLCPNSGQLWLWSWEPQLDMDV